MASHLHDSAHSSLDKPLVAIDDASLITGHHNPFSSSAFDAGELVPVPEVCDSMDGQLLAGIGINGKGNDHSTVTNLVAGSYAAVPVLCRF